MKRQISILAILTMLIGFVSCKSTSETASSNQTESKEQKQGRGERPDATQILEQMDADNDGKIALSEAKGPLKEDFSKIDTDDDGYITKEELEKASKNGGQRPQGGRPQGGRN